MEVRTAPVRIIVGWRRFDKSLGSLAFSGNTHAEVLRAMRGKTPCYTSLVEVHNGRVERREGPDWAQLIEMLG